MPELERTGWTATASSQYDADTGPEKALDGINIQNATFWISEVGFPHWIAVDMGSSQTFNYIRYVPGNTRFHPAVFWGQHVPTYVKVYVSDNGVDWALAGEQIWPQDGREHWVLLDSTVTARYFKLEGVDDHNTTSGYHRMCCAEIYAGLLVEGESYKRYVTVHPLQAEDLTPYIIGDPEDNGLVDYMTASPSAATLKIRVWHTCGLCYYPEVTYNLWDLPENWLDLTLETVSIVVAGNHYQGVGVGTYADFALIDHRDSSQTIIDFLLPWNFTMPDFYPRAMGKLFDSTWAGNLTQAAVEGMYSNLLIWHSLSGTAPTHDDADVSRLIVTDHYLLLVYGAIYSPSEEEGGDEGDEGEGWPGYGENNAMLLIDLDEERPRLAYLDEPERLPEYD